MREFRINITNRIHSFRDNKRFLDHGTKRRINKEQSANQLIANELIGILIGISPRSTMCRDIL